MILRCTKKLLDVIKPAGLAEDAASPEDWYANRQPIDLVAERLEPRSYLVPAAAEPQT